MVGYYRPGDYRGSNLFLFGSGAASCVNLININADGLEMRPHRSFSICGAVGHSAETRHEPADTKCSIT